MMNKLLLILSIFFAQTVQGMEHKGNGGCNCTNTPISITISLCKRQGPNPIFIMKNTFFVRIHQIVSGEEAHTFFNIPLEYLFNDRDSLLFPKEESGLKQPGDIIRVGMFDMTLDDSFKDLWTYYVKTVEPNKCIIL